MEIVNLLTIGIYATGMLGSSENLDKIYAMNGKILSKKRKLHKNLSI
jgi:hypothetical protein